MPHLYARSLSGYYVLSMRISIVLWVVMLSGCITVHKPVARVVLSPKKSVYQEIDLESMIKRYIAKHEDYQTSIEGIYTVSAVVIKKGNTLLTNAYRERVVDRKDNYARVAILKDWPGSNTEYVEVSLNEKNAPRYPIVGEINKLAEGNGFICKHIEPKGETMTFTFLYDNNKTDILEGVYSVMKGRSEITYKLTYVKIYPKNGVLNQ